MFRLSLSLKEAEPNNFELDNFRLSRIFNQSSVQSSVALMG